MSGFIIALILATEVALSVANARRPKEPPICTAHQFAERADTVWIEVRCVKGKS